jgi:uncharacterized surface protein with fasciclin (FAS1) repeats
MKNIATALTALVIAVAAVFIIAESSIQVAKAGSGYKTMAIYPTAKKAGFETLTAAIEAAELDEVLTDKGPFTVFAPTDEAFAKLPGGTLESLLNDKDALKQVLLYHVVSGEVMAADVVKLKKVEMLNGQDVTIDTEDGVKVNDANVIKTDIKAKNGVIHVIDTVLIPSSGE